MDLEDAAGTHYALHVEQQRCRQTAPNLEAFIRSCVDKVKSAGAQVRTIVSDNAANITATMPLFSGDVGLLGCFSG